MLVKKVMKVNEIKEEKKKKLLMILWIKLKNDSDCEKISYNFVKNEYNMWLMDNKKWLGEKLMKKKALNKRKKVQNKKKKKKWSKKIIKF